MSRRRGMLRKARMLALWFVAAALSGCGQDASQPQAGLLAEGKPFPEIALNFSGGNTVSTRSFQGKVLILNFWATWCPPCRKEMPGLEQLSRTLDPRRFAVIGVSADRDAFLAEEFLRQNQITFANFFDHDGKLAKQLGLQVFPETFLIGSDGILLQRVPGLQEWSSPAMVAQLEDLYRNRGSAGTLDGGKQQ